MIKILVSITFWVLAVVVLCLFFRGTKGKVDMSYQTIKTYFKKRLATFNYVEAKKKFAMEGEAVDSFDGQFIVECSKTEVTESNNTLATRFFPQRTFLISIAKKTSKEGTIFEYDSFHTRMENVIRDLHSASNFRGDSIRNIQFKEMAIRQEGTYLLAEISFNVEDSLNYV